MTADVIALFSGMLIGAIIGFAFGVWFCAVTYGNGRS